MTPNTDVLLAIMANLTASAQLNGRVNHKFFVNPEDQIPQLSIDLMLH